MTHRTLAPVLESLSNPTPQAHLESFFDHDNHNHQQQNSDPAVGSSERDGAMGGITSVRVGRAVMELTGIVPDIIVTLTTLTTLLLLSLCVCVLTCTYTN